MSLTEAKSLLSTHAIHDAVIPTMSGAWHSSPALADLDGDGQLEIIAGTSAWHNDGRPVAGWPQAEREGSCSVAVGDVDGDGKPEVAVPGFLWRGDGASMSGWPIGGNPNPFCTPGLCDVDGDGKLEILYTDLQTGVCIRRYDGTMLPGWPVAVSNNDVRCTPMSRDVNGDGKNEIVFVNGDLQEVRIHHLDGSLAASYPLPAIWVLEDPFLLNDIDHDGHIDLLYGNRAMDLSNGQIRDLGQKGGGTVAALYRDKSSSQTLTAWCSLPESAGPIPKDISIKVGKRRRAVPCPAHRWNHSVMNGMRREKGFGFCQ